MKIHHIGIACQNIEKSRDAYKELGYTVIQDLMADESRNLDYIFLKNDHETVELVSVNDKSIKSDIDIILASSKMGCNSIYHICYQSNDIIKDITNFKLKGYKLLKKPEPTIVCENRLVAFLFHSEIGLIELIQ